MKNQNNKLFKIVFLVFLAIILLTVFDLAKHTTGPWNKKKQTEISK